MTRSEGTSGPPVDPEFMSDPEAVVAQVTGRLPSRFEDFTGEHLAAMAAIHEMFAAAYSAFSTLSREGADADPEYGRTVEAVMVERTAKLTRAQRALDAWQQSIGVPR